MLNSATTTISARNNYAYDANGNTLTDPSGKSYTWDFENRLIQAVVPGTNGGTTTFKYDPFGRRIQKSGPLGTTNYLYDGFVAQSNVIEEVDSTGNVLARYTLGTLVDEPLAQLRGSTTSYYQQDAIGSVTALGSSTGTLANTYTYDSFGNITASIGSIANPFRYAGRHFDPETGIYHYRARYYDESAGRFVSEDPMRFAAGYNFYTYVANDPVVLVDPTGLKCCDPNAERADIERSADFARNAINTLTIGGYITGATHVGGETFCIVNTLRLPNGQVFQDRHYDIDIKLDKDKHPCLYDCAMTHELVHRRQCMNFGPTFNKLSHRESEVPAYMMELGCYLRQMMAGGFGPYGSN